MNRAGEVVTLEAVADKQNERTRVNEGREMRERTERAGEGIFER
ncbi:MAG: hypothetical protein JWM11_2497 [Planctomycetaceae bacterium]|nr:hypothetical protein [Planctomycetaceae bacterium]